MRQGEIAEPGGMGEKKCVWMMRDEELVEEKKGEVKQGIRKEK